LVLLETKKLSKSFGGLRALFDVNTQIGQGTIHGLIGPNGSGKSTFFNIITGIYQPDAGSHINFAGQDITSQSAHQIASLGVSRTFQLLRLFLDMTVLENVMVGYHCHSPYGVLSPIFFEKRVRRAENRIRQEMQELLEFLGLIEFADLPANELSGGQKKLLSLGRAIAMRPKLLLLDEPGAGLSPVNIDNLMETILTLKERYQLTVVVVEHVLKLVMNTCERITVLDHGQKIAEGTPEEVKGNSAVVEAYLGKEMADEEIRRVFTG